MGHIFISYSHKNKEYLSRKIRDSSVAKNAPSERHGVFGIMIIASPFPFTLFRVRASAQGDIFEMTWTMFINFKMPCKARVLKSDIYRYRTNDIFVTAWLAIDTRRKSSKHSVLHAAAVNLSLMYGAVIWIDDRLDYGCNYADKSHVRSFDKQKIIILP